MKLLDILKTHLSEWPVGGSGDTVNIVQDKSGRVKWFDPEVGKVIYHDSLKEWVNPDECVSNDDLWCFRCDFNELPVHKLAEDYNTAIITEGMWNGNLSVGLTPVKLANRLIAVASQENCDGEEYDLMIEAAKVIRTQQKELTDQTEKNEYAVFDKVGEGDYEQITH